MRLVQFGRKKPKYIRINVDPERLTIAALEHSKRFQKIPLERHKAFIKHEHWLQADYINDKRGQKSILELDALDLTEDQMAEQIADTVMRRSRMFQVA